MSKSFTSSTGAVRFSRQWWGETARIAFWVVIVTVLIWVYADMEFTQTEEVRMTVRLTVGKSTDMALVSRSDVPVVFTLRGRGTSLKRFASKYNRTVRTFDLSKSYRPGADQAVPTAEVLTGFVDELRELGLTVRSAEPKAITGVYIDTVETHEVPVEFRYAGAQLVKEPAAEVLVRVAATSWKTILEKTGPKEPRIKTAVKDFKSLAPGDKRRMTFELLSSIAGIPVHLDTAEVAADIEVRRLTASKKIAISVRVVVPVSWTENGLWKEYQLKRKDPLQWRRDITVVGPREHIDRLKPVDVDAYIVLVEDDKKPVSWSTRKVVLRFPPDLQITLADGQDEPTVQFRLEKRTAATPP